MDYGYSNKAIHELPEATLRAILASYTPSTDRNGIELVPARFRYIHTENFGSFDTHHIRPQKGSYIIREVEKAVGQTGGHVFEMGPQYQLNVRFPTPSYWVSGGINSEQVVPIALGIFMDYERRWENWQGTFPTGWSSYFVEDLPSDYLGFYMAATGKTLGQTVLQLGPQEWNNSGPSRFGVGVCDIGCFLPNPSAALPTSVLCPVLSRNYDFTPYVNGQNVPWPQGLQLPPPISSSPTTWQYVGSR
jgi:hypothetical protein